MSYDNVLVNFRVPVSLKNEFEDACKRLHMPMTAQANLLMREFVHRQKKGMRSFCPIEIFGLHRLTCGFGDYAYGSPSGRPGRSRVWRYGSDIAR